MGDGGRGRREIYGRPQSSAGVAGRRGGRKRAHAARRMAGGRGGGSAAGRPRHRRPDAVVRRAGRHRLAARAADRQRPPRRHGVRQRRHRAAAAQRGHRLGRRPVRLRATPAAPARCREIRRLVFAEPVEPGAEPDRPDHARQPGRPARLPARRQPPARRSPAPAAASEYRRDARPDHRHRRRRPTCRTACATGGRCSPARPTR